MSTHTEKEKGSARFSKFMSTQVEDLQENIMVARSDGIIAPMQESATSIQTISFSDDIMRVMIQQEGQLIMFADATSYREGYQNQQQEQQHTIT
jgi:hypothetical protein